MSHPEKLDAVIHGIIETVAKPALAAPFARMFANIKKRLEILLLLFTGVFVLASCGSTTTTTTTTTATNYPNASLLVSGAALNVNATNQVIIDTSIATHK